MNVNREYGPSLIYNMYYEDINAKPKYILDSNVLVNFEKLFYHPDKMPVNKKNDALKIHKHIKENNIDVDYSHGLAELSIDLTTGEQMGKKYYSTRRAIKEVLKMSPNRLLNYSRHKKNNRKTVSHEYKSADERVIGSIRNSFHNTSIFVVISYVCMMKFYQLIHEHELQKKERIYKGILDFMHKTLNGISLYDISAITYFLFTSDSEFNSSQSLMKVNKKIDVIKKSWNVSWDMGFIRYINEISGRQRSGEIDQDFNHILVTNDQALSDLAESLVTDKDTNYDGKYVPNAIIDENKISKRYRKFYNKQIQYYMSESMQNERRSYLKNINEVMFFEKLIGIADEMTCATVESDN